jgi:O-antigen/teichoic acid export membrane protein
MQFFSGSVEQGFYSLGFTIGAIIFMFSKSMTPLFTREFSIALHKNDTLKIRHLFEKLLPQFFFITAFIALYIFLNIDQIVILFGGSDFRGGSASIAIMCLYPIHQTLGQLTGSIYYASERTKTYSKIGILGMLTGLVLSFLFLAPEKLGAFDLAAYGLALKMVINQFLYGGVIYTLIIILTIYFFPNLVMISRTELTGYILSAKQRIFP